MTMQVEEAEQTGFKGSEEIVLDSVVIGKRLRRFNEIAVESLKVSIADIGLLQPILVRSGSHALICGAHRLEACRRLGWKTIPAVVSDTDDLTARQSEIEENLRKTDLTALEKIQHLAALRDIYAQRGEMVVGPGRPSHNRKLYTMSDLAEQMGIGRSQAQSWMQASTVPAELQDQLFDTRVAESVKELLELAATDDPVEQANLVQAIVQHDLPTVQDARRMLHPEARAEAEEDDEGYDHPGDDVGERYPVVTVNVELLWDEDNPVMRKRVINGEEKWYPREAVERRKELKIKVGAEALEGAAANRALWESIARQGYAITQPWWPPARRKSRETE